MAVLDQNVRDPRIRRTRKLLQDALRQLLRQKRFDEILVQDITETATVNRATFYDHYADKYSLFNALVAADFQMLLNRRNVCFDGECTSGLAATVLAVGDFLEQMHQEHADCTGNDATGPLVDSAITLAIRQIVLDGFEKRGVTTSTPREVLSAMIGGVIYSAVKEWLSKTNWRVDEQALRSLVPLVHRLIEDGTAAA